MGWTGEPRVPEYVWRLATFGPVEEKHVVCRQLAVQSVASSCRGARHVDKKEKVKANSYYVIINLLC